MLASVHRHRGRAVLSASGGGKDHLPFSFGFKAFLFWDIFALSVFLISREASASLPFLQIQSIPNPSSSFHPRAIPLPFLSAPAVRALDNTQLTNFSMSSKTDSKRMFSL